MKHLKKHLYLSLFLLAAVLLVAFINFSGVFKNRKGRNIASGQNKISDKVESLAQEALQSSLLEQSLEEKNYKLSRKPNKLEKFLYEKLEGKYKFVKEEKGSFTFKLKLGAQAVKSKAFEQLAQEAKRVLFSGNYHLESKTEIREPASDWTTKTFTFKNSSGDFKSVEITLNTKGELLSLSTK